MRQHGLRFLAAAVLLGLLAGCATGGSGENGGNVVTDTAGDVAGGAGRTATDATQGNINQEVRRGVNSLFDDLFKRK